MEYCDQCGCLILPHHDWKLDVEEDNLWRKERKKLEEKELSKRKGLKKLLYKLFSDSKMPFYPNTYFIFCSNEHYSLWKKMLIKRIFALQANDGGSE